MKKEFKKWLCELADCPKWKSPKGKTGYSHDALSQIEILVKAMWAINRDGKCNVIMHKNKIIVRVSLYQSWKRFNYCCNKSEEKTLIKALEHIWENIK